MNDVSQQGQDFFQSLRQAVAENPISAGFIGLGGLWLLAGRGDALRPLIPARKALRSTAAAIGAGSERVQQGVSSAADTVRIGSVQADKQVAEFGEDIGGLMSSFAEAVPGVLKNAVGDTRLNLSAVLNTYPLAIGFVGLAIGATVAAALPVSEVENAYLGESSDLVKKQVTEIAGQQAERAIDAGRTVVKAVKDEAQQQGITSQDLKAKVSDLSDKVSSVASSVFPI